MFSTLHVVTKVTALRIDNRYMYVHVRIILIEANFYWHPVNLEVNLGGDINSQISAKWI